MTQPKTDLAYLRSEKCQSRAEAARLSAPGENP